MLTLAREFRGVTQASLAQASGVSQQAIQKLEVGVPNAVGEDKFLKVAEALEFPIEFFGGDEVRLSFGSSSYFYRKKLTTAAERGYISGIVNLVRIHLSSMLKLVEAGGTLPLPRILTSDGNTPEMAANTVRAAWNLPDGPIPNLTSLVEKAGIIIIECPFGTRSIDGTSMYLTGLPPMILLNDALPPDRYRFTLAHELGHLVMHDTPIDTMEDEADAFASELLMQEVSFRVSVSQLSNKPSLKELLRLKPYWRVAVSAMIMKLHQIGKIKEQDKRSLFILMSKNKMRMNEPQSFEKERPKFFKAIFDASLEGFETKQEAAKKILNIYEKDFKQLYGALMEQQRPRLRIVG